MDKVGAIVLIVFPLIGLAAESSQFLFSGQINTVKCEVFSASQKVCSVPFCQVKPLKIDMRCLDPDQSGLTFCNGDWSDSTSAAGIEFKGKVSVSQILDHGKIKSTSLFLDVSTGNMPDVKSMVELKDNQLAENIGLLSPEAQSQFNPNVTYQGFLSVGP